MKTVLIILLTLICNLTAELIVDKDKFGRVQTVMYTGFVMDGIHAQSLAKQYTGIDDWVKKEGSDTYTSGHRIMTFTSKRVVIVLSYEQSRANLVVASARVRPATRPSSRFGSRSTGRSATA